MKQTKLIPKYVDYIPEQLADDHLYICEQYKTVAHKCCCGCGEEVITPLSPAEWSIRKEGNTVTLHPSIGNWSFKCQSHYWIRKNQVIWAKAMSQQEIQEVRARDAADKAKHIAHTNQLKAKTGVTSCLKRMWANFLEWIKK
ncbi:MAG: DUF6527 family protein [Methylophilus sp.]